MSIEILKVIKEAEEKAEIIKKEALLKSKEIIANANSEALNILNEAMEKAETGRMDVMAKAQLEGQELYETIINEAKIKCDNILMQADKNMDHASSIILERIVKTSGNS